MKIDQSEIEDRRGAFQVPLEPGSQLMSGFVRAPGRPVYRPAPGVAVPRLEQVPSSAGHLVVPNELHRYRRAPEAILRPTVAAWLDQPEAQASRKHELDTRDLAQLKALTAAALRDVVGLTRPAVAEWVGSKPIDADRRGELMRGGRAHHSGEMSPTRRQILRGRRIWVQLAAWPWWPVAQATGNSTLSGGLVKEWWELPQVVETYNSWMCP